jgi:hypothetical protein
MSRPTEATAEAIGKALTQKLYPDEELIQTIALEIARDLYSHDAVWTKEFYSMIMNWVDMSDVVL